MELRERFVGTNGIRLHLVEAGPAQGSPVLLLHGFPDFWYGWRKQIPALVAAGFRVYAPDQRGYNLSDKPPSVRSYAVQHLIRDVSCLIEALGHERVSVVGHDWGGLIAWALAMEEPQRVDRLVAMNAPHPAVMSRFLRYDLEQLRRSWYAFMFQLPWIPETLLLANDRAALVRTMRGAGPSGMPNPADLERYRQAWSRPGALTGMLNWYRAAFRQPRPAPNPRVKAPTLILWGMRDPALSHRMARPSMDHCASGRLVLFPDATHWLHHDAADDVNSLLVEFLQPARLKK